MKTLMVALAAAASLDGFGRVGPGACRGSGERAAGPTPPAGIKP